MIYLDTETCGFHGPIVLLQYALDDGPVELWDIWTEPIGESIDVLEQIANHEDGICGFNLEFDWFHICQTYTVLRLLEQRVGADARPVDHIDLYVELEPEARLGPCLKPYDAIDLMAVARRGEYQSLMDRKDITIKRVPLAIAEPLIQELNRRIVLKDVYFARTSDPKRRWKIQYIEDVVGFVNLKLAFAPSSALKALAQDALEIEESTILRFADIDIPSRLQPKEIGFAPFAKANKGGGWALVINYYIGHWGHNKIARSYAEKDVVYLQMLRHFFSAKQVGLDDAARIGRELGYTGELIRDTSDDSVLACMVGAVRWRGYAIDEVALRELQGAYKAQMGAATWNMNAPRMVIKYLTEVMTQDEQLAMRDESSGAISSRKMILEELAKWRVSVPCSCMGLTGDCPLCNNLGYRDSDEPHPAAVRAQEILDYRQAGYRYNLINKFLLAGRFHASFKVIGTLSSRMAGDNGLNAQGVPHVKAFRRCFPLADDGLILSGGDFSGFEVSLADAVYGDPDLRHDLQTGLKIHALFGQFLFPPMTHDEIVATAGLPGDKDKYGRSKNGVFALLYGGEAYTLRTRVGVSEAVANDAYHQWVNKYKVWGDARKQIFNNFCSMRQPNGIGSKVEWSGPADYAESILGFKRYFTLENKICKALYDLAESPPKEFLAFNRKVTRRDREQTESGALRSALFAAAFALQASNMRAAANHVIQSSGAQLTKRLQRRLWSVQPPGVGNWRVVPMNIHDEIMCPVHPDYQKVLTEIVESFVHEHKPLVPLLDIDWHERMASWAEK